MNTTEIVGWILRSSWQAGILVVLVLAAQWALGKRLNARWHYLLWFLVVARLALPSTPSSSMSLFNYVGVDFMSSDSPRVEASPLLVPLVAVAEKGRITHAAHHTDANSAVGGGEWRNIHVTRFLAVLWALGAGFLTLRMAWQHAVFTRQLKKSKVVQSPEARPGVAAGRDLQLRYHMCHSAVPQRLRECRKARNSGIQLHLPCPR